MIEFYLHAFMTNVLNVTVELLNRVSVIIAAITFQLGDVIVVVGCGGIHDIFELVFVAQTACELGKEILVSYDRHL